ncbi:peptidase M3 [Xylanibacillus composti]|uniref:Peptidase M3A/M3B catalytic domain-containing protein n=1 Tax=Xylanibacillus composti TaxID=1572762 RepID=A0A8J4M2W8_9BACL|nr:M3 family metallopeptidase [Xylanibacillus composti]MDT9726701.1 peptidase M3 [Xylanibacillus composti]GIQ69367.1 hypothetical protein XYCOK13_21910 [Xylanibacillus composti]
MTSGEEAFLNTINTQLAKPYADKMHALWMLLTSGDGQWAQAYEQHEQTYRQLLASPEWRQAVKAGCTQTSSPLARRQWTVLRNEMLEHHEDEQLRAQWVRLWNELNVRISMYRTTIEGRSLTEKETRILFRMLDNGGKRKQLWHAYMRLGEEIAAPLIEQVRMRNRLARARGFPDYYAMKLAAQEMDGTELDLIVRLLKEELQTSYRKVKEEIDQGICRRFGIAPSAIRSWHYPDPFFQSYEPETPAEAIDLHKFSAGVARWLEDRGIWLGDLVKRMDLGDGAGKSSANFCLPIDRGSDVRISCQVSHDDRGARIVLHEFGHAFAELAYDPSLPFLLRQPAHPFLSEAAALLMERLLYVPGWRQSLNNEASYVQERDGQRDLQASLLVKLFWTMTLVQFERKLYENPDGELNRLWWELVEEYQEIARPEEWDKPYWASKPHLSTLPATYYYYLLGEVAASELQQSLDNQYGEWHNMRSLQHMRRTLFQPGISRCWKDALHACAHRPLRPQAIIGQLQLD